jgi:hypothetical protein
LVAVGDAASRVSTGKTVFPRQRRKWAIGPETRRSRRLATVGKLAGLHGLVTLAGRKVTPRVIPARFSCNCQIAQRWPVTKSGFVTSYTYCCEVCCPRQTRDVGLR